MSRYDDRSEEARLYRRMYGTARWKRIRQLHLSEQPLCAYCMLDGRVEPATVVDHRVPHRGNEELFFLMENLQSLCDVHHSGTKQAEESRGYSSATDVEGWPIDPHHPANRNTRGG